MFSCQVNGKSFVGFVHAINNTFLTDYIFNMYLFWIMWAKNFMCVNSALWGVVMYNDNGVMGEQCYQLGIKGGKIRFTGIERPKNRVQPKPGDIATLPTE